MEERKEIPGSLSVQFHSFPILTTTIYLQAILSVEKLQEAYGHDINEWNGDCYDCEIPEAEGSPRSSKCLGQEWLHKHLLNITELRR